jgi:hypothetical protein
LSRRLPIARIAVTEPPRDWFGGIAHAFYRRYRHALAALGLEVFDVPIDAFVRFADAGRQTDLIGDLRDFRPELALGLSHGAHALVCRLPAGRGGFRPNLFTDVLDIPTICTWDHAPLELAEQLLTPHPATPAQSTGGMLDRLRRALCHPRLIPWSRDSGQTALMSRLGLMPRPPLFEISPAFPDMTAPAAAAPAGEPPVAYIGALYPGQPADRPAALTHLATGAIARWLATGGACWDELDRGIAALPARQRDELALDPDQSFFWAFVHRVIAHEAQTARRLDILGAIDRPVAFYGQAHPGLPRHLRPCGTVPFGAELAAVYAHHPIVVDVQNPGFIHGFGHKPVHAFAAGGFMLVDRKADFVAAFADAGDAVSYASHDELAGKIDRFLAAPAYRREVGDAIRARIAERHSLPDVLTRILEQAAATATAARAATVPATTTTDLLPLLRRYSPLSRARFERRGELAITTSPKRWTYAASVRLPPTRAAQFEATMIVEAGCVDIGLLADDRSRLIGEKVVGPSRRMVTLQLELPDGRGNTVVLRNAHEGASRARIGALVLREPSA